MEIDSLKEMLIRIDEKQDQMRLNIGHLEAMYKSEERQRDTMKKDFTSLYSQVNLLKYKVQLLTWATITFLPLVMVGIYNTIRFIIEMTGK